MEPMIPCLPPERLSEFFALDEASGRLTWQTRPVEHFKNPVSCARWNRRFAGTEAGSIDSRGYRAVMVDCVTYKVHRIVYAMTRGEWPTLDVDHINRDRSDNRPSNLRDVNRSTNLKNRDPFTRTKK